MTYSIVQCLGEKCGEFAKVSDDCKGWACPICSLIQSVENTKVVDDKAPILSGDGFSEFWKAKCPSLPWFKAMQKFHAEKEKVRA